jgi:mannose-6-phosphate isomerase
MSTHPNGCSLLSIGNELIKRSDFIAQYPQLIFGGKTTEKFGQLPYLFKVLGAEKVLAFQVHPSKPQA